MQRLIILHVERNREDSVLLERSCRAAQLSCDFYRVHTSEDAMAYLKGEEPFADRNAFPIPHLIVLNIGIGGGEDGGMSGYDLLTWVRASDFRKTPVLIFADASQGGDPAKAIAVGAEGYFLKPKGFQALVEIAEKLPKGGEARSN